jgi:uncharacterized protein YpbB
MDESGFQISALNWQKRRSLKGTPASLSIKSNRKRLNVISAMSAKGVIYNRYVVTSKNKAELAQNVGGVNANIPFGFKYQQSLEQIFLLSLCLSTIKTRFKKVA